MDRAVMPALLVAFVVVGGIYGGVFTPTEGAAVGCVAMLAIGVAAGRLGWPEVVAALKQTAETSGMIFMILLGPRCSAPSSRSRACPPSRPRPSPCRDGRR